LRPRPRKTFACAVAPNNALAAEQDFGRDFMLAKQQGPTLLRQRDAP